MKSSKRFLREISHFDWTSVTHRRAEQLDSAMAVGRFIALVCDVLMYFRLPLAGQLDTTCRSTILAALKPFLMHNAIYRLLQDENRLMKNKSQTFEVIINCTVSALHTCMQLHYSRSWILRLIRQENPPNLQYQNSSTRKSQNAFKGIVSLTKINLDKKNQPAFTYGGSRTLLVGFHNTLTRY